MPTQIICTAELRKGTIVPVLPQWRIDPLDVHMLPVRIVVLDVDARSETAREIIVENIARL